MKVILVLLVCFTVACSSGDELSTAADITAEIGVMRLGTSEIANEFYGGPSKEGAPDLFSMGRTAVICNSPSRLLIRRESKEATIFTTTVRCTTKPTKGMRFSVVGRSGEEITLLHSVTTDNTLWHPMRVEVDSSFDEVLLVAGYELAANAAYAGPEVAWANSQFNEATHPAQPDVIVISIDTLRSSALSHAPFLSSLIAQGRHYINAYSPSNWTLPSFASLVSGLTPQQHRCTRSPFSADATGKKEIRNFYALADVPTFAEAFRDSGYATAFIHQNPFLESWTNIQQGFEMYARTADRVDSSQTYALDWWRHNQHRKRLLLMHFMEPHWPYSGTDDAQKFFGKDISDFLANDNTSQQRSEYFDVNDNIKDEVTAAYYQQIEKLDAQIKFMFSLLNKTSNNYVVVIHVDHGEELWDQGSFEHGHSFADCVVKVPLAIIHDGHINSEQIPKPVSAHHIGNYLLEYLGIGSDMPPSALGSNPVADRNVTSTHPLYRSAIGGKVIHADGSYSIIHNHNLLYDGERADIPSDVLKTLSQLGYSGH